MEVLPWMKALCSEEFYEKCTKRHEKQKGGQIQSRSPVYNIFCIDCEVKVCACCQLPHDGHALLQIRRASMQDAVLAADITSRKLMDISDIQLAKINGSTIVYIGHHLSSTFAPIESNNFMGCKQRRAASSKGPAGRLPDGNWTYCSIACKVAGLTRVEPRLQASVRVRTGGGAAARLPDTQPKPAEIRRKSKREKAVPARAEVESAPNDTAPTPKTQPKPRTPPPPSPPPPTASPLAPPPQPDEQLIASGMKIEAAHSLLRSGAPTLSPAPAPTLAPSPTPAEQKPVSPSGAPEIDPLPAQQPGPTPSPKRVTHRLMQQRKKRPVITPAAAPAAAPAATSAAAPAAAPTVAPDHAPAATPAPAKRSGPAPAKRSGPAKRVKDRAPSQALRSKDNAMNISLGATSSAVDLLNVEEKAMLANQPRINPSGGSFAFDVGSHLFGDESITPRAAVAGKTASPFDPPFGTPFGGIPEVDTPGFGYVPPADDTPASEAPGTYESSLLTDRTPIYDFSPALLNPPSQYTNITQPIPMPDLPFVNKSAGGWFKIPLEAVAEAETELTETELGATVAATPAFKPLKEGSGYKGGGCGGGSGGGSGLGFFAPTPDLAPLPSPAPTPVGDFEAGKAWLSLGLEIEDADRADADDGTAGDGDTETPNAAGVKDVDVNADADADVDVDVDVNADVGQEGKQAATPFKSKSAPRGKRMRTTLLPPCSPLSSLQGSMPFSV